MEPFCITMMFYTYQTLTELKLAYNIVSIIINYSINHIIYYTYYAVLRSKHAYITLDIRYIPIFDISIQFKLCRYCITGLMYHDTAIYQYIVASLVGLAQAHPKNIFQMNNCKSTGLCKIKFTDL